MQSSMPSLHIKTPGEMAAVATQIISHTDVGEHAAVVALHGDLGAGKTTLVQMLAKKMGVKEEVTSPTFVIMKKYQLDNFSGEINELVHIDAYRIEESAEMEVLGFSEIIEIPGTLVCVEWAENIKEVLPKNIIEVNITISDKDGGRDIQIHGY